MSNIADTELAGLLNHKNFDLSKLKSILQQMKDWHNPQEDEVSSEEIATFQKLQAMMGDDAELDLDELADEAAEKTAQELSPKTRDVLSCPQCGTSWKDIHEDGLVGCPHCYETFAAPLEQVMDQLHGSREHAGKIPRFREKQQRLRENQKKRETHRLEMLQNRLDAAIQSENYEEAAQIRNKMQQVSDAINLKTQNTNDK